MQGTACEAASSSQGLLAEGLPRQERAESPVCPAKQPPALEGLQGGCLAPSAGQHGTARLSPNQATAPGLETAWGSARLLQGCSGLRAGKEELAG